MNYDMVIEIFAFTLDGFKCVFIIYLISVGLQYVDNFLQLKQYKLMEDKGKVEQVEQYGILN